MTKEKAAKLMGALLRIPPNPHSEMKLGKPQVKPIRNRRKKQDRPSRDIKSAASSIT
jgi:hypothetical protein